MIYLNYFNRKVFDEQMNLNADEPTIDNLKKKAKCLSRPC